MAKEWRVEIREYRVEIKYPPDFGLPPSGLLYTLLSLLFFEL
jgi:hypothetical protein